ncbi:MAG: outer membrane protein OmpA-like peptidoglycan-associated protein [Bradymonadia bacterium]|jgi:outer membrane protein OmpA-like peptidoglycan-associated protein
MKLCIQVGAMLIALLVAPLAQAQLPIGWGWSTTSEDLTISIEAFDVIEGVELTIQRQSDRESYEFSRGGMDTGEVWNVELPLPRRTTDYTITVAATFAGIEAEISDTLEIGVVEPMDFDVDADRFDSDNRRFYLTMTQPAGHVEIVVRGDSGELLTERTVNFGGEAPGTDLEVNWTQGPGNILTVDVRAVSASGAWASRQYIPWKVEFDAAHVNFASGSAEVPAGDVEMLRGRMREIIETAARVEDFVEVKLYIGGYTDSVGNTSDNQRLSEERAEAIASFFEENGVTFPIYYQGFGEDGQAVTTADSVDESQNRRSVFILSTREPPHSGHVPRSNWQALN